MKKPDTGLLEVITTSQNDGPNCCNLDEKSQNLTALYQKCITCPDYGKTCNGPKLAAMESIMVVRDFHRTIRDTRSIPMRLIYLASHPISESTINDYFSNSDKDFKWTTVACIDNGITAICGNRIGKPPLDHPCPASSTEIKEKIGNFSEQINALKEENAALQAKVTETKGKIIATRDEVKEDYASRLQFLKDLCESRHSEIEEMKIRHQKELERMESVAANYLARIDEKNARIDRQSKAIKWLSVAIGFVLILLTCYFVWDLAHPNAGFFRW